MCFVLKRLFHFFPIKANIYRLLTSYLGDSYHTRMDVDVDMRLPTEGRDVKGFPECL